MMTPNNDTIVTMPQEPKNENKAEIWADRIKRLCYVIVALVNSLIPALVSMNVMAVDSKYMLIPSGITTFCLLVASKTSTIEDLLKKYNLDQGRVMVKLNELQSFNQDMESIKSDLLSMKSRSIPNEPVEMLNSARTEILTGRQKIRAYYNKEANTIEINYIE